MSDKKFSIQGQTVDSLRLLVDFSAGIVYTMLKRSETGAASQAQQRNRCSKWKCVSIYRAITVHSTTFKNFGSVAPIGRAPFFGQADKTHP